MWSSEGKCSILKHMFPSASSTWMKLGAICEFVLLPAMPWNSIGRIHWKSFWHLRRPKSMWCRSYRWMFPKIIVPQNGWFIMENPIKMDDFGVPVFLETPRCLFCWMKTDISRKEGKGKVNNGSNLKKADKDTKSEHTIGWGWRIYLMGSQRPFS